jgi:lipopolysaccharide/colanic/teichoic acid biosynthesis glycosyltransferase
MRQAGRALLLKKVLDRTIAAAALTATAPILAVAMGAVRVSMGAPVLFRQIRPGLHEKPFRIFKMRTMTDERGPDGRLLSDEERLTRLGRFLRATSIDELPQLLNVLAGDLSLVGPRPLLMEYLPLYSAQQARRHDVMPGITGWAQIHGRNAISWEAKFDLDVWYVDHWTPWLDVKILAKTVRHVLARKGISQEGSATMTKFRGSRRQLVGIA